MSRVKLGIRAALQALLEAHDAVSGPSLGKAALACVRGYLRRDRDASKAEQRVAELMAKLAAVQQFTGRDPLAGAQALADEVEARGRALRAARRTEAELRAALARARVEHVEAMARARKEVRESIAAYAERFGKMTTRPAIYARLANRIRTGRDNDGSAEPAPDVAPPVSEES